jgi:phosphocarrier protein HPr
MQREVEILNELGLHARPAAEFVRTVKGFDCEVTIHNGTERFSAESIIEVLTANLDRGARVILEAEGPDAEVALDRLEALLHEFKEQEEREGREGGGNGRSFPA